MIITSSMLMSALLIVLGVTFLLGLIRHPVCMAFSGLGQLVLVPIILVVAYLGGFAWLAGYFTAMGVSLLLRAITAANAQLAKKGYGIK